MKSANERQDGPEAGGLQGREVELEGEGGTSWMISS